MILGTSVSVSLNWILHRIRYFGMFFSVRPKSKYKMEDELTHIKNVLIVLTICIAAIYF